jgi:hypothetical protein
MPKGWYADHFRHIETLLQRSKARSLPTAGARELRADLQENLRETRRALWQVQTARIEERQARRMKQEHLEEGKDLAIRLRSAIRASRGCATSASPPSGSRRCGSGDRDIEPSPRP